MKISREIIINGMSNNTEYELTGIELERAFNEYQSTHDRAEVIHQLRDLEYEDLENIPEDIIADLASQVRERMNDLMDEVILEIIRKNGEVLEPYKEKWKVFTKKVTLTVDKEYTIKARNEEEADALFERWSERHGSEMLDDLTEDAEYNGDFDYDDPEEYDEFDDPDNADIVEGRNV